MGVHGGWFAWHVGFGRQPLNMAELTTTVAATAVTGATAAIAAGLPPQEVLVWSLLGALVAVWLDREKGEALTVGWALRAVGLVFVSVLSGIAGSAGITALADVPMVSFLAKIERWVAAFAVAALIHKAGPWVWKTLTTRFQRQEVSDVAGP